jgi:hypothetical protein
VCPSLTCGFASLTVFVQVSQIVRLTHARKILTHVVRLEQTQGRLRHIHGSKSHSCVSKFQLRVCKSHFMCSSLTYSGTCTHARKSWTHVVRLEQTQVELRHIYGFKSHLFVSKSHLRVCKSHCMSSSLTDLHTFKDMDIYSKTWTNTSETYTHIWVQVLLLCVQVLLKGLQASLFMCLNLTYSDTYTHARKSLTQLVRLEQTEVRLRHIQGSKSH